jgi:hypothetical protein
MGWLFRIEIIWKKAKSKLMFHIRKRRIGYKEWFLKNWFGIKKWVNYKNVWKPYE